MVNFRRAPGTCTNGECEGCNASPCELCENGKLPIAVQVEVSGFPDTITTGTYSYPDNCVPAANGTYACDTSPTTRTSDVFGKTFHSYEIYGLDAILNDIFEYEGDIGPTEDIEFDPPACDLGTILDFEVDAAKFTHAISSTSVDIDGNASHCASSSKTHCKDITADVQVLFSFRYIVIQITVNDPGYPGAKPTWQFRIDFADTVIDYCNEQSDTLDVAFYDYYMQIGGPAPVDNEQYICEPIYYASCRTVQSFTVTAVKNAIFAP